MTVSKFREHPYLSRLLLGPIFVIGVAEVIVAGTGIFPTRYEWILGCLLFATTLAWTGAVALAGATAPVSNKLMKYAYGVLLVVPLAVVASFIALGSYELYFGTRNPGWIDQVAVVLVLALWLWMVLVGLVGSLAPRSVDARAYIPLVIAPLLMVVGAYSVLLVSVLEIVNEHWPNWIGRRYTWLPPLVAYGWIVFLLYWRLLSRLTWIHRLRSIPVFITLTVSTLALVILAMWAVLRATDLLTVALFGVATLAPFGAIIFRSVRPECLREQMLRKVGVSMAALSIAMASYCVVFLVGLVLLVGVDAAGGIDAAGWGVVVVIPYILGIFIVSLPVGYLVSKMGHPHRNLLVAAIGPGLVTLSTMGIFWFGILDKSF